MALWRVGGSWLCGHDDSVFHGRVHCHIDVGIAILVVPVKKSSLVIAVECGLDDQCRAQYGMDSRIRHRGGGLCHVDLPVLCGCGVLLLVLFHPAIAGDHSWCFA